MICPFLFVVRRGAVDGDCNSGNLFEPLRLVDRDRPEAVDRHILHSQRVGLLAIVLIRATAHVQMA